LTRSFHFSCQWNNLQTALCHFSYAQVTVEVNWWCTFRRVNFGGHAIKLQKFRVSQMYLIITATTLIGCYIMHEIVETWSEMNNNDSSSNCNKNKRRIRTRCHASWNYKAPAVARTLQWIVPDVQRARAHRHLGALGVLTKNKVAPSVTSYFLLKIVTHMISYVCWVQFNWQHHRQQFCINSRYLLWVAKTFHGCFGVLFWLKQNSFNTC